MRVNRPLAITPATAATDGRLYLRDQELDDGAMLIRSAGRRLAALAREAAGDSELPALEIDVLVEVGERGPVEVGELRHRLDAPKQTLARHLNALEARGLTVRIEDSRDRRRRLVTLTDAGRQLAAAMIERRRDVLREAFRTAGADAVAGARRVMSGLIDGRPRIDGKPGTGA